jgi:glyoxylase-like metal-dependent hydrolase (beta-lactamase superfamily II)
MGTEACRVPIISHHLTYHECPRHSSGYPADRLDTEVPPAAALLNLPVTDARDNHLANPVFSRHHFHRDAMVLHHQVFFSSRPSATRTGPTGSDHLRHVPTSSTLIYGEKDAVLVDTQLTIEAADSLTEWVASTGKNLVAIYITHAHGDHHFGTATLLKRFSNAKVLATPEVASRMEKEHSPERLQSFWEKLFPGQIPVTFASATSLPADEFELEGEKLMVVRLGHTDSDETTALWVPSIRLLIAGDSVYGNTHPFMGESGTVESRLAWISALDKLALLDAKVVVGGHSDPKGSFGPDAIGETKAYFKDFNRIADQADWAQEVYGSMMELYPERLNPGSLWSGAMLVRDVQ